MLSQKKFKLVRQISSWYQFSGITFAIFDPIQCFIVISQNELSMKFETNVSPIKLTLG